MDVKLVFFVTLFVIFAMVFLPVLAPQSRVMAQQALPTETQPPTVTTNQYIGARNGDSPANQYVVPGGQRLRQPVHLRQPRPARCRFLNRSRLCSSVQAWLLCRQPWLLAARKSNH